MNFDYTIIDHGIDHPQFFIGASTIFTGYHNVAIGCGDTFNEALNDALDQLASMLDEPLDYDAIFEEESLPDDRDAMRSASVEERIYVSNDISPTDYDCPHFEPSPLPTFDFCEECHENKVNEILEERNDHLAYYVSILYNVTYTVKETS